MSKDPFATLEDILESIDRIEEYVSGLDEAAFCSCQEKQDAVFRRLEIIGESARRVPQDLRDQHLDIPWRKMIALRNVLAHEYDHVICTVIWDTIKLALPPLKIQLLALMGSSQE